MSEQFWIYSDIKKKTLYFYLFAQNFNWLQKEQKQTNKKTTAFLPYMCIILD